MEDNKKDSCIESTINMISSEGNAHEFRIVEGLLAGVEYTIYTSDGLMEDDFSVDYTVNNPEVLMKIMENLVSAVVKNDFEARLSQFINEYDESKEETEQK